MHLDQLQQYIRFAISQLSSQNGQADFEKISLYFSRQRIHRNILPATGPVQAGGDQGRDFETFHSYLSNSPIANSSFIAEVSEKPIVFACSLEKNPTKKNGKIISDVRTITSGGTAVEKIYFFSGQDIAVAGRHKTIDAVKKDYRVDLEIIDANALAQHLADPDLFWVATQFLKVPSDIYPKRTEHDWYSNLLSEYQQRTKPITTYEEFEDVKSAIRFIYKNEDLKSELPLWYPKLDELIATVPFNTLVRKAIYERFVTAFVGLEYVEGLEQNIERYFKDFENYISNSELEDANHLLTFCQTAVFKGRLLLSQGYLDGVASRMDKLIPELIEQSVTPDNKCALLEIRASFNLNDRRGKPNFAQNFENYIDALDELIDNLDDAHFFPFERLADRLNKNLGILLKVTPNLEPLEEILAEVDHILAKKGSAWLVGSKLRDRAAAYMDNGEYNRGLRILHELKIKWFNHETIEGCVVTCLFIGTTYKKQGLYFASKYYNMVAAYLAHKNKNDVNSDKIIQGLAEAGECDYATGSWASYLGLTETLLHTHQLVTKDFDLYDSDETMQILYYPSVIFKTVKAFLPVAEQLLKTTVPLYKDLEQDLVEIDEQFLKELEGVKLRARAIEQIAGIPLNDFSAIRTIVFNANGCDWRFSFSNSYNNSALVEEYICIFQVVLQEMADEDLHLWPGTVNINIQIVAGGSFGVKQNNELIELTLASFSGKTHQQRQKYTFDLLVYAQMLLYLQSALPENAYKKILDPKLKSSALLEKATFGQSYEFVYKEFHQKRTARLMVAANLENPFADPEAQIKVNPSLIWKTGKSPLYDRKKSLEAINRHIAELTKTLSTSFPILKQQKWFQNIVNELRKQDWLDWQIFYSLAYLIVNAKVNLLRQAKSQDEFEKLFRYYLQKDEKDWYRPIDQNIVSLQGLQSELKTLLPLSLLSQFGLDNKKEVPDFQGLLTLLNERFCFGEDGKEIILFNSDPLLS